MLTVVFTRADHVMIYNFSDIDSARVVMHSKIPSEKVDLFIQGNCHPIATFQKGA